MCGAVFGRGLPLQLPSRLHTASQALAVHVRQRVLVLLALASNAPCTVSRFLHSPSLSGSSVFCPRSPSSSVLALLAMFYSHGLLRMFLFSVPSLFPLLPRTWLVVHGSTRRPPLPPTATPCSTTPPVVDRR